MKVDAQDTATVILIVVSTVLCVLIPVLTHYRLATRASLRDRVLYGSPAMVILQIILVGVICGAGLLLYTRLSTESPEYWPLAALHLSALGSDVLYAIRYARVRRLMENEALTVLADEAE